jgi:hypothetical protein
MFGNLGLKRQYYENANHNQTNGLWDVTPRMLDPEEKGIATLRNITV